MRDAEAQLIHDMQNTAMVLREAAGQLHEQRDSLPPAAVAHLTAMLARRSDMLVQLLGDLSTSHLAGRGELDLSLQAVSLPSICGDLVAERRPAVGSRVTVEVAEDALVLADPIRVTQVLDNLLVNALRYGGPDVRVHAERAAAHVLLTVSDDGPGVSDDLQGRLFDAYAHGASSHGLGGSGLGLRIARQLCEAMGGTIEYARPGRTAFTVRLPALPTSSTSLVPDEAHRGHAVTFWHSDDGLAERLVPFVAHGLTAGEAVVVTATRAHQDLLATRLEELGIDATTAAASGQYVPLDAEALHTELPRRHHIDRDRFDALVGETVQRISHRWRGFRVFGEIVDLYWRRWDDHLAFELESCWDELRTDVPFPLLCAYELPDGGKAPALCECHDAVIPA
jgi:hypothetical protein